MKGTNEILILAVAIVLMVGGPVQAQIDYSDFSSVAGVNLVGDAAQYNNRLRLTPASSFQLGAAWFAEQQAVQYGFETQFQFQITGGLADGFAFVIQNSSPNALGLMGGGLGYHDIQNSLAVEFDTWLNPPDPDSNHVSVQTRGTDPNTYHLDYSLGFTSPIADMSDGSVYTVKVTYEPGTMKIFIDDLASEVLEVSVDLETLLNLDAGKAWVGFTGATGGEGYQNHDILNWYLTSAPGSNGGYVDIKPGSWPNPLNTKSKGVLPVAVLGTEDFDVMSIDPGTILMVLEGFDNTVSPIRWNYEDVGTPYEGEQPGGHDLGSDGLLDLTLKFDTQALVDAFDLYNAQGQSLLLSLSGNLTEENGGLAYQGSDWIWVLQTGDANGDGFVGELDLTTIITSWGMSGATREDGDLNGDGTVTGADYTEVITYWGTGTPPAEPRTIPEPATLALLLVGALMGIVRRR